MTMSSRKNIYDKDDYDGGEVLYEVPPEPIPSSSSQRRLMRTSSKSLREQGRSRTSPSLSVGPLGEETPPPPGLTSTTSSTRKTLKKKKSSSSKRHVIRQEYHESNRSITVNKPPAAATSLQHDVSFTAVGREPSIPLGDQELLPLHHLSNSSRSVISRKSGIDNGNHKIKVSKKSSKRLSKSVAAPQEVATRTTATAPGKKKDPSDEEALNKSQEKLSRKKLRKESKSASKRLRRRSLDGAEDGTKSSAVTTTEEDGKGQEVSVMGVNADISRPSDKDGRGDRDMGVDSSGKKATTSAPSAPRVGPTSATTAPPLTSEATSTEKKKVDDSQLHGHSSVDQEATTKGPSLESSEEKNKAQKHHESNTLHQGNQSEANSTAPVSAEQQLQRSQLERQVSSSSPLLAAALAAAAEKAKSEQHPHPTPPISGEYPITSSTMNVKSSSAAAQHQMQQQQLPPAISSATTQGGAPQTEVQKDVEFVESTAKATTQKQQSASSSLGILAKQRAPSSGTERAADVDTAVTSTSLATSPPSAEASSKKTGDALNEIEKACNSKTLDKMLDASQPGGVTGVSSSSSGLPFETSSEATAAATSTSNRNRYQKQIDEHSAQRPLQTSARVGGAPRSTTSSSSPSSFWGVQLRKTVPTNNTRRPPESETRAVSSIGAATSTNSSSSSSKGLSELSKQLRLLQGKNQSQSVEIDRLERQLRILSELKGVDVVDLRRALEHACESEAHGEWQSRVASLRAELEMTKTTGGKTPTTTTDAPRPGVSSSNVSNSQPSTSQVDNNTDVASVVDEPTSMAQVVTKTKSSFQEEAASKTIATLQLRVGELEEVEDELRTELRGLYESLSEQTAKATRMEAESKLKGSSVELQRQEIEQYRKRLDHLEIELHRRDEEDKKRTAMVPYEPPEEEESDPVNDDENAIVPFEESRIDLLFQYQSQKTEIVLAKAEAAQAKHELQRRLTEIQVSQDQIRMLESQLRAREKEWTLRNDQYRARFQLQDERIQDLEQQLSSLYTAFDMVREERSADEASRVALFENLLDADKKVAHQMDALQEREQQQQQVLAQPLTLQRSNSTPNATTFVGTEVTGITRTASFHLPSNDYGGSHSSPLTLSSTTTTVGPNSRGSSVSPPPPQPVPIDRWTPVIKSGSEAMISGFLWKRNTEMFKLWKKRYFSLYEKKGGAAPYELHYTEGPRRELRGTLCYLTPFVSTVTECPKHQFPNHPHAFVVRLNPEDPLAPVIYAAANNSEILQQWMVALTIATTTTVTTRTTVYHQHPASRTPSPGPPLSLEEQEASDHAIALQLQYG